MLAANANKISAQERKELIKDLEESSKEFPLGELNNEGKLEFDRQRTAEAQARNPMLMLGGPIETK